MVPMSFDTLPPLFAPPHVSSSSSSLLLLLVLLVLGQGKHKVNKECPVVGVCLFLPSLLALLIQRPVSNSPWKHLSS